MPPKVPTRTPTNIASTIKIFSLSTNPMLVLCTPPSSSVSYSSAWGGSLPAGFLLRKSKPSCHLEDTAFGMQTRANLFEWTTLDPSCLLVPARAWRAIPHPTFELLGSSFLPELEVLALSLLSPTSRTLPYFSCRTNVASGQMSPVM